MQYCSLQHQTLLPSPVTSTNGCCFCFGSISSFWSYYSTDLQLAYWAPANLGSSSFSVIPFYLFILFVGLRQEYQSGLPFPSPVHHVLSELSTMTHPYWVALYSMAHSFTELDNWRRQWHPTPVLLPGKSHGWRSLEGCSPWGR